MTEITIVVPSWFAYGVTGAFIVWCVLSLTGTVLALILAYYKREPLGLRRKS